MRKKILICAVVYAGLFLSLYLPQTRYSAFENRFLTTFEIPEMKDVISLKWMDEFETALCEQFNFRNLSITIKTYTDKLLGRKDNGRVYFGDEGYLMQMEKKEYPLLEKNIEVLNQMASQTEVPITFMPIYSSLCTLNELAPQYVSSKQLSIMQQFKDELKDITIIDGYDVLKGQKDAYYKTDHHWTMQGAKVMYDYWKGETTNKDLIQVKSDFLGTLYYQAPTINTTTDKMFKLETSGMEAIYSDGSQSNSYYFDQFLDTNDSYRYYMGGNFERIDIHTKANNQKRILVIKDSYANSFIPFLNDDYEYITVIDMRYGNTKIIDVLNEGYDECLLLFEITKFCEDANLSKGV